MKPDILDNSISEEDIAYICASIDIFMENSDFEDLSSDQAAEVAFAANSAKNKLSNHESIFKSLELSIIQGALNIARDLLVSGGSQAKKGTSKYNKNRKFREKIDRLSRIFNNTYKESPSSTPRA